VHLPPHTSLRALVALAHQRWAIEQQYQELKSELGEHARTAELLGQAPQQHVTGPEQWESRAHRVAQREQPGAEPVGLVGCALDPMSALETREQHGAGRPVQPERPCDGRGALARARGEVLEHRDDAIGGRRRSSRARRGRDPIALGN